MVDWRLRRVLVRTCNIRTVKVSQSRYVFSIFLDLKWYYIKGKLKLGLNNNFLSSTQAF